MAAARPTRILLVEDLAAIARMLTMLLERRGHEVHVAYDGPSALEIAGEVQPELNLLHIGLPRMEGYEVARRLRERPKLDRTLLIALTADGREEDRRRSREAGSVGHFANLVSFTALDKLFAEVERIAGGISGNADLR